ncbi:UvrB/UvrC motif-containing protein [Patescibacteria group bacterium]|nr:UvrB/UvrC motif-containing protein [Patescibacteria group bacterium]
MDRQDVNFSDIPDAPGVYFFKRGSEVVYVGKATSLRSRVRSYFDGELLAKRGALVDRAVRDATSISVEQTDSVLEALILEASYIKKYSPSGNSQQKDDKSFNYVVITREEYPRVLVLRGRELDAKAPRETRAHVFGPFTQGAALRDALKIIRKIFPFYDAASRSEHTRRFYRELGLYPGEDRDAYRRTIRSIVLLFSGKKRQLIHTLEREMHSAARAERFETAALLRKQVFALTHIQDIALIKDEYRAPPSPGFRIEAFDTAHLRGEAPRAVMTVVENSEPDKAQYRVFTIRTAKGADDFQALREVLTRRFAHPEWPYPQLIVIDGGATHLKVARTVLKGVTDAEVCAVVKDEKHRPRQILGKSSVTRVHEKAILLANAEAHRFSIGRHRRALRATRRGSSLI